MSTSQFLIIIFFLALIYNGVVLYLYFRAEITKFIKGDKQEKKDKKKLSNIKTEPVQERSLVGKARENAFDFIPKQEKKLIENIEVIAEETLDIDVEEESNISTEVHNDIDNSFSTDDIEEAMNNLSLAIDTEKETLDDGKDLYSQLGRLGNLKIDFKKGNETIERNMMVLDNTIVI
jgi:ABC-type Na+ efflux pump permease subunit